jgi:hypothetical protein
MGFILLFMGLEIVRFGDGELGFIHFGLLVGLFGGLGLDCTLGWFLMGGCLARVGGISIDASFESRVGFCRSCSLGIIYI